MKKLTFKETFSRLGLVLKDPGNKVVRGRWNISSRVLLTRGASKEYMGLLFSLLLYVFENSQKKKKRNKQKNSRELGITIS